MVLLGIVLYLMKDRRVNFLLDLSLRLFSGGCCLIATPASSSVLNSLVQPLLINALSMVKRSGLRV